MRDYLFEIWKELIRPKQLYNVIISPLPQKDAVHKYKQKPPERRP